MKQKSKIKIEKGKELKMLNKSEKLLFAAFATFVVIAILPLNASAQTKLNLDVNQQQVSNLTKYLTHVNVTQTPWMQDSFNGSNVWSNEAMKTAPTTNHILFIAQDPKPYEAISGPTAVVDGLVICGIDTGHTIYGNGSSTGAAGTYAFDENTGKVVWFVPGISPTYVFNNTHMLCGTTMINPNNGQIRYTVPRSLGTYAPDLKISFGSGPAGPLGSGTIAAYDWTDPRNPKLLWTTTAYDNTAGMVYSNGRVFFGGRNQYELECADARNGTILWSTQLPSFCTGLVAGYGKIFTNGWTGSECIDQKTGKILWIAPQHGREVSGYCLAYGKYYFGESNIGAYALDVNTGGIVWQYTKQRASTDVFPAAGGNQSNSATPWGCSVIAAGGMIFFPEFRHTAYGIMLPPNWKSLDGLMFNPHPYSVIAQCGTGEIVALDANYGNLIWKSGTEEVGAPGPSFGTGGEGSTVAADGRLYGVNSVYSGHVSFGNRYSMFVQPQQFINYEWYPPALWCYGKGPTQFNSITLSSGSITKGQQVTVSGVLSDLSPPIDSISICSQYSRPALSPATNVPVNLSFIGASGAKTLATVNTDKMGKFSYSFSPTETGSIVLQSYGRDSYEAPDTTYTSVQVTGSSSTATFIGFTIFAIIVATAVPVIVIRRKPEP